MGNSLLDNLWTSSSKSPKHYNPDTLHISHINCYYNEESENRKRKKKEEKDKEESNTYLGHLSHAVIPYHTKGE